MTPTTDLLSIGRFSRLSGISVPSLRRYDAMALLPPASVDPQSGYRRYDPAQLARARAIRRPQHPGCWSSTARALSRGRGATSASCII
jgi:DNA-binding transcriptional MerR regulator